MQERVSSPSPDGIEPAGAQPATSREGGLRTCFVIGPDAEEGAASAKHLDDGLHCLIEPACKRSGYALRTFDQGLGRSLWFVEGASGGRIGERIGRFPRARQADLWSGVGLACAYAGGVGRDEVAALRETAGEYAAPLAQGAAFAAKSRVRACNVAPHTELACQVIWGLSAAATSEVTDEVRVELPPDGEAAEVADGSGTTVPAFEIWRQRIQRRFASGGTTV